MDVVQFDRKDSLCPRPLSDEMMKMNRSEVSIVRQAFDRKKAPLSQNKISTSSLKELL